MAYHTLISLLVKSVLIPDIDNNPEILECKPVIGDKPILVIISHGDDDGSIEYLDYIESILSVYERIKTHEIMIVCCHPRQVYLNNPRIQDYIFCPEYDGVIYTTEYETYYGKTQNLSIQRKD